MNWGFFFLFGFFFSVRVDDFIQRLTREAERMPLIQLLKSDIRTARYASVPNLSEEKDYTMYSLIS